MYQCKFTKSREGLKEDRIKELAKEFVEIGVKAVVLIGGGEPMAHPEFGTLVDYFYENDIHVGVTSNGTLIHKYRNSLAYHNKWVRISVDEVVKKMFFSNIDLMRAANHNLIK